MNFRLSFLLLILLTSACKQDKKNLLKPIPSPTKVGAVSNYSGPLISIFLTDLGANPAGYENQLIQVTGSFERLEKPDCKPYKGPISDWSLVADGLRLEAVGFERVVNLAPEQTPVTVNGVWRQYIGMLGCGKEPALGKMFYLEVLRIVSPNPMPAFGDVFTILPTTASATPASPLPLGAPPVQQSATPIISIATFTPSPLNVSPPPPVTTATENAGNPPTATPTNTPVTPLISPTVTPSPTPTQANDNTVTPTASNTPSPVETATPNNLPTPLITATLDTSVSTFTPIPPLITTTPGSGYPSPVPPTTTVTPDPY